MDRAMESRNSSDINGRRMLLLQAELNRVQEPTQELAQQPRPQEQGRAPAHEEPQTFKMLIFLQNGEERLIAFTPPQSSCTLQEVLDQVCVPVSAHTHVQCMHKDQLLMNGAHFEIDYFVAVGRTTSLEKLLENHPLIDGACASRSD